MRLKALLIKTSRNLGQYINHDLKVVVLGGNV